MHLSNTAPVVFVQYLAAIAIIEGIKSYDHGYSNVPVKLKWPNDICRFHSTDFTESINMLTVF
jgi:biotin--protein ligase